MFQFVLCYLNVTHTCKCEARVSNVSAQASCQLCVLVAFSQLQVLLPTSGRGEIYTHFSLCVRTVLADLFTLSVSLCAGGMFHWSVS